MAVYGEFEKAIIEKMKEPENTKKGSLTTENMFITITTALRKVSHEYERLEKILDYAIPHFTAKTLIENDMDYIPYALVNTGGSEGIYIDWYFIRKSEGRKINIGTFKTLQEDFCSYGDMGCIAGMLVWATEEYLYRNDHLFAEEN